MRTTEREYGARLSSITNLLDSGVVVSRDKGCSVMWRGDGTLARSFLPLFASSPAHNQAIYGQMS